MATFFNVCLLILPWVVIPVANVADQFRLPKAIFFDFICLGMISLSLKEGLKFTYRNKYLFWLVSWVFVVIFVNWFIPFVNTYNNEQTINYFILEPMIHFILGLWLTYIIVCSFDKEVFIRISRIICLSSVLVSIFGILQILGFNPANKILHYQAGPPYMYLSRITAFLDHPSVVGNFLCLSLPFFFNFFKEKKYIFGFLVVLAALLFTRSLISYIACFLSISLLLFLFFQDKKVRFFLYGIFALISGFALSKFSYHFFLRELTGRQFFWKSAVEHFKNNSFFGQGLGVFKTFGITFGGKNVTNPHSDWFNLAIEIGLLGIFLIILVIINSLRNFNYKPENRLGFTYLCSFISFLILMTGSFVTLQVAPVALLGLIGFCGVEKL